tara:strand:+ start:255 stop:863 length:609 start_codon:yes stop_codon:yes gene_type:complete
VGADRSDAALGIKQLGCVRGGWPASVNEQSREELYDPNLHSLCHCTLAGLLAVDWEVACSATVRGAQALRPRGEAALGTQRERRLQKLSVAINPERYAAFQIPGFAEMTPAVQQQTCDQEIALLLAREGLEDEEPEEPTPEEEGLRGVDAEANAEAASAAAGPTRREVMGDDVVSGLHELQTRMLEGGAAPEDVRLIICFDN